MGERDMLMKLVSFKWLMGCAGWPVDMRRPQIDPGYSDGCLGRGAVSDLELLRRHSTELRHWLAGRNNTAGMAALARPAAQAVGLRSSDVDTPTPARFVAQPLAERAH